jgi:hypothetical protein
MLSMPYLLTGAVGLLIYREVRAARKRLAQPEQVG